MDQVQERFQAVEDDFKKENIFILEYKELNERQKVWINNYFTTAIFPILTPLAVDPSHPFPFISNLSLNLAAKFNHIFASYVCSLKVLSGLNLRKILLLRSSYDSKEKMYLPTSTLKRNLGTFADDPDAYFNRRFTPREIAKFPFRKLRDVYQLEDDIFKIMHFENTKKYLS